MYITTTGLILRETLYKESSKILTVLTSAKGKITVSAKGVRRRGSKMAAACQLLTCSEMTLYCNKGRYTLTEARSLETFDGLREDIELLSLGSYFAELLDTLCGEEAPEPDMMSLGLNALFALTEGKRPKKLIKAAFELRLMCLAGFEPMLHVCGVCDREDVDSPYLSIDSGMVHCRQCRGADMGKSLPLCTSSLAAMRYVARAEPKKMFSFRLGEEALGRMEHACEEYVKKHLDREFRTLDFYKSVLID